MDLKKLLSQMTLEEKVGQCVQLVGNFFDDEAEITGPLEAMNITEEEIYNCGSVIGIHGAKTSKEIQEKYLEKSRLKIPLVFMADVIHGSEVIFPTPLAISSSFNTENAKLCAQVSAKEATISGNHVTFAPMADLARDARWGRNMESSGEDPYLNTLFTRAYVEGFQGDSLKEGYTMASCVKHFAGYGLVQAGREYNTVDVSERFLREYHFPAYKEGFNAGASMVMTAFNTVNSIPCTGNKWLFRNVLRDEMNFKGVSISDWGAVKEMINHQVAADEKEAAIKAMNAGCDMEMMTPCYYHGLKEAVASGDVDIQVIDEAVLRILELKEKLGLFENPYRFADESLEGSEELKNEYRTASRKVAEQCPVLLKNDDAVLPLKEEFILAGGLASSNDLNGEWSWKGDVNENTTIAQAFGKTACSNLDAIKSSKENVVVYVAGEYSDESGEARSKVDIDLCEEDVQNIKAIKASGKKVILVLISGRPMVLTKVVDHCDAILIGWQLGTMTGYVIKDILDGTVNPSGKLTMSFPYHVGQCPIFYNDFQTGRPLSKAIDRYTSKYIDSQNEALYTFGEGMNYSNIKINNISFDTFDLEDEIKVSIDLQNNGIVGTEVVQLYINDLVADVIRPLKELRSFERITVEKEATVEFILTREMMKYYNAASEYKVDKGQIEILIGLNSKDVETFTINVV